MIIEMKTTLQCQGHRLVKHLPLDTYVKNKRTKLVGTHVWRHLQIIKYSCRCAFPFIKTTCPQRAAKSIFMGFLLVLTVRGILDQFLIFVFVFLVNKNINCFLTVILDLCTVTIHQVSQTLSDLAENNYLPRRAKIYWAAIGTWDAGLIKTVFFSKSVLEFLVGLWSSKATHTKCLLILFTCGQCCHSLLSYFHVPLSSIFFSLSDQSALSLHVVLVSYWLNALCSPVPMG
jgi:hypothetical protein